MSFSIGARCSPCEGRQSVQPGEAPRRGRRAAEGCSPRACSEPSLAPDRSIRDADRNRRRRREVMADPSRRWLTGRCALESGLRGRACDVHDSGAATVRAASEGPTAMNADPLQTALQFAAALGLGVLLGLERERQKGEEGGFAGVRTFGLIALSGALAAYLEQALQQPWLALALFVGDRRARDRVLRRQRVAGRPRRHHRDLGAARLPARLPVPARPGGARGGPRRGERRRARAEGVAAPPREPHRDGGRRGDAQVRDREHHHPAARSQPELRAARPSTW